MNFENGIILIEEIKAMPSGILIGITIGEIILLTIAAALIAKALVNDLGVATEAIDILRGVSNIAIGLFLLIVPLVIFYNNIDELSKPTGVYRVVVTDEADINEFQQLYDIIDYSNGVYKIKVKETSEVN